MQLRRSIQASARQLNPINSGEMFSITRHASRITLQAMTLMELLVVISIIALLSAIALPAMKGFGRSNLIASANRQLLDDLARARQRAISDRTTVHVVFVSPEILTIDFTKFSGKDQKLAERLKTGQFTSYALFSERTVGDQPGQPRFRYLTSWHSLPDGIFVAPWEFQPAFVDTQTWDNMADRTVAEGRPCQYASFPFPSSTSGVSNIFPHIAFDPQGRLLRPGRHPFDDEVISLARGSILYSRNEQTGALLDYDVRENPPDNSRDPQLRNWIRIDALTGRAKLDQKEIQ